MSRLRSETGAVLVTAMMLMAMMTGVALAAYALVDTEERNSSQERIRETSFNLGEQLLASQVFILSRDWPGKGGVELGSAQAYPSACSTGVVSPRCPEGSTLVGRFGGPDVSGTVTWSTRVRDNANPNPNYYDDAVTQAQPAYDANGDDKLWVRAQAIVRGKRRTLVGLVRIDRVAEDFPKSAIIAGKFQTTNNGNKVIVETGGAPVQVRCTVPAQSSCMDYPPSKGQLSPDTSQVGYTGGDALSDEALDRLRERAKAEGTWYAGCPSNPSGALVFVEDGNCSYNNSAGAGGNSAAAPGVFINYKGSFSMNGNIVFHGLVYTANRASPRRTDYLISLSGTSGIEGAAMVDGPGGLSAGSSKLNLLFKSNVFNNVVSYANAGIIQNTWREIRAPAG